MENAEEVFHFLEEFSKRKPKTIPQELNDYLAYVARTGDPVYQWSLVKSLFKEKLLNVITDFYETTPGIDIPPYPNVDPFNYDIMKNSLLERLDSFTSAPFTIQRICELLTYPRKQYNRVDKFMRAIEKNILVVSTREPGAQRHIEQENGEPIEPIVNGSDNNSEYNVDVEMEDVSWKENSEQQPNTEPQPSSSDTHIPVDNGEARLQAKPETMDTQEKTSSQYEADTSTEHNSPVKLSPQETQSKCDENLDSKPNTEQSDEVLKSNTTALSSQAKEDIEMKSDTPTNVLIIPEIKIDDAEMTEQKINAQPDETYVSLKEQSFNKIESEQPKSTVDPPQALSDDSCSSSNSKDDAAEPKIISEVSTSSEESSSSSDITDGNSNSPKTDPESQADIQVESITPDSTKDEVAKDKENEETTNETSISNLTEEKPVQSTIQSDNYSISDVNSEIPQVPSETLIESEDTKPETVIKEKTETNVIANVETKTAIEESPAE